MSAVSTFSATGALVSAGCAVAALAGAPRWLRVAQREHYVGGSVSWVRLLWLSRSPVSYALFGVSLLLSLVGVFVFAPLVVVGAALAQLVPLGLPWRGRTSPLAWTTRLKRVAAVVAVVVVVMALISPLLSLLAALAVSVLVDLALFALKPVEARLSRRFLVQAHDTVERVRPTVVAITGSYGKTTTKNYLAHLLAGSHTVLASPASFNNAMGLSRAVNENLVPGTEVFVAEMGTYGKGEIRALCDVFPPDIAVLTAIGEVHLQRMKSREGVLAAKAEITERARTVVINADEPLLAGLDLPGKQVIRCSLVDPSADVAIVKGRLRVRGQDVGEAKLPESVHPAGVACALGAALALGDDLALLAKRLPTLPSVAHRLEATRGAGGSWVLDDTYNSNPVGAAEAVRRARVLAKRSGGRVHVVTPGMVELGKVQYERNEQLAQAVVKAGAATLVVVGRTNSAPLLKGGKGGGTEVVRVRDRAAGVALVEQRSGPGDVVLFENDLPDHYP